MNTLMQHIRFGLRLIRKSPVFYAVVIVVLALGIGAIPAISTYPEPVSIPC